MDVLSDQLFDGPKIRILAIMDMFSKVSPAIDIHQRYKGSDVVDTLERMASIYGLPKSIRADNGPEFISRGLDLWAWRRGASCYRRSPRCRPSSHLADPLLRHRRQARSPVHPVAKE